MESSKLIVGVLMGGASLEREVSFNSGRTICDHLDEKYIVKPIFQTGDKRLYYLPWRFLYRGKISDFENRLEAEATPVDLAQLNKEIDFMYLSLHGKSGEDGSIQGLLEMLGIPYLGSKVKGSVLGMAKKFQTQILANAGFLTPKTKIINKFDIDNINQVNIDFDFPVIVKPAFEGSSIGIEIANNHTELTDKIKKSSKVSGEYQDIIIQEYINGREFSCTVIVDPENGKPNALPITEVEVCKNKKYFCYDQKYMPGKAIKNTPASFEKNIAENIQKSCIEIMKLLNISNIMRMDGFVKEDKIYFLDANTIPGTGPTSFLFDQSAEAGYSHRKIINMLIESELRWGNKNIIKPVETINYQAKEKEIAVILGGNSNEKEISLESGRNIVYKLQSKGYKVKPIFLDSKNHLHIISERVLVKNSTAEIENSLDSKPISFCSLKSFYFVYLGLHGGIGENGTIQGALEALDISFNGSKALASVICMDKDLTKIILKANGLETIPGILISRNDLNSKKWSHLKWPLILKPHDDGCSNFVSVVKNDEELLQRANILLEKKEYILIEQYINGKELTIGVLGTNNPICMPISEVIRTQEILSIEEKFLPGAGENQTPAKISKEDQIYIQEQIIKAYKALGCENYARIDCFLQSKKESDTGKSKLIFIEFNSLPALSPATCLFHQAAELEMRPAEFLEKILLDSKKNRRDQTVLTNENTMEQSL